MTPHFTARKSVRAQRHEWWYQSDVGLKAQATSPIASLSTGLGYSEDTDSRARTAPRRKKPADVRDRRGATAPRTDNALRKHRRAAEHHNRHAVSGPRRGHDSHRAGCDAQGILGRADSLIPAVALVIRNGVLEVVLIVAQIVEFSIAIIRPIAIRHTARILFQGVEDVTPGRMKAVDCVLALLGAGSRTIYCSQNK